MDCFASASKGDEPPHQCPRADFSAGGVVRLAAALVAKCRRGTKVVVFVDDLVDHLHPRRGRVCRHPSIPQVVAVERPGSCGVYQRAARDALNPGWQPVRSVPSMCDVIKSELRTAVSTYDLLNVKRELLSDVAFTCALSEKNAGGAPSPSGQ